MPLTEADMFAWPKGRELVSLQWLECALHYDRADIVARFLCQVAAERHSRVDTKTGSRAIAKALHAPSEPTSPGRRSRSKNEQTPHEDVGKYILDQISAGYSTTAAIALGMQLFGIKERAAYYALRRARWILESILRIRCSS